MGIDVLRDPRMEDWKGYLPLHRELGHESTLILAKLFDDVLAGGAVAALIDELQQVYKLSPENWTLGTVDLVADDERQFILQAHYQPVKESMVCAGVVLLLEMDDGNVRLRIDRHSGAGGRYRDPIYLDEPPEHDPRDGFA